MEAELQRRIQRYGWDRAAQYYEAGWEELLWPAQEHLLDMIDPQPGEKILDVSCGTGLVTLPLAGLILPDGDITGIDLSEKMIDIAMTRTKQDGIKNAAYKHMDAEELDFPDQTFDKAVCSLGLMYFPNPGKSIEEIFRVLKPGGSISALVWGERKHCGWAGIFPIVDSQVKTDVCPLFFQQGTGNVLANELNQKGFKNVVTKRIQYTIDFEDDEHACTASFRGGAVALAYHKFDKNIREEVNREYLDSIKEFKKGKGYSVPAEFLLVRGGKMAR